MSAEQEPEQPKKPIQTIADLVDFLAGRQVARELGQLEDEALALMLQVATVKAEDPKAKETVRDLRIHLLKGGNARDFLEEHPEHTSVSFENLVDELGQPLAASFPKLIPTVSEEIAAPSVITELPESEDLEDRFEELAKKYPAIMELFDDNNHWIEDERYPEVLFIKRKSIEHLLVPRDPDKPRNAHSIEVAMSAVIFKRWKELYPDQELGRKILGHGRQVFLTGKEAIDFLWFLHTNLGKPGLGLRLQITPEAYQEPVSKKK